ncbi:MAG: CFI-box-CTERM domain-containing protein [Candidatus Hadarchaeum sp.]|uniref:CFI-box-CTERM domain-containing protein n=1 Tax=Candidatus Hadarchaeum sp. TaxID=2883567 RepID=UPI003D0BDE0C
MAKEPIKEGEKDRVKEAQKPEQPKGKKKFTEVDPRTLISVPTILCPVCGLPMEIKGRKEVEKTARTLRGKTTRKIPHLVYQCAKDKTEFNLNLERRGGGCFIATAAFGTSMAHEINVLRSFRDNYLMRESAGRLFVSLYYRTSPTIARMISRSKTLKFITRVLLTPIVKAVQKTVGL